MIFLSFFSTSSLFLFVWLASPFTLLSFHLSVSLSLCRCASLRLSFSLCPCVGLHARAHRKKGEMAVWLYSVAVWLTDDLQDREYLDCPFCKNRRPARIYRSLWRLPSEYLVLHIKRFAWSTRYEEMSRINTRLKISKEIDMRPYCSFSGKATRPSLLSFLLIFLLFFFFSSLPSFSCVSC